MSCGGCVLPRSRRVAMYSSGHSDGYYSSTRTTTVVDYTPHGAYRYFTVWSVSKTKVHLKWKLTQPERYGVTCAWMLWLVIVLGSFGHGGCVFQISRTRVCIQFCSSTNTWYAGTLCITTCRQYLPNYNHSFNEYKQTNCLNISGLSLVPGKI